jgi:hypothetical protein
MGRILTNNHITQANVEHYIEQATRDYSTFLSTAPTFCTYYSRNHLKSTFDRSLENINEVIGADSPVKFDKVENLPIYKIDNASFATEITDFGISGTVTSTAVVVPDTVVPLVDDVFIISYQNARKVFQVTDVEQDNYNNAKYYKISFRLSTHNIEDVEQQVYEEYTVDYNLIGQQRDPVIKKSHFELSLTIESIYDALLLDYLEIYYDRAQSAFVDPVGDRMGRTMVDPLNNRFIRDEGLHRLYRDYRQHHHLNAELTRAIRPSDVNKSLYGALQGAGTIEVKEILASHFTQRKSVVTPARTSRYTIGWFSKTSFYVVTPIKEGTLPNPLDEVVQQFGADFLEKIQTADLEEENPYKKFLIKAFNGYYTTDKCHEIPEDVGFLDDYPDNYYIVPLVLFSLRYFRREVVNGK